MFLWEYAGRLGQRAYDENDLVRLGLIYAMACKRLNIDPNALSRDTVAALLLHADELALANPRVSSSSSFRATGNGTETG